MPLLWLQLRRAKKKTAKIQTTYRTLVWKEKFTFLLLQAALPIAWCFSTRMKEFQDVFLKSVTNHNIQFHFVSKWLAIDILWKSEENQQTSQGSQI